MNHRKSLIGVVLGGLLVVGGVDAQPSDPPGKTRDNKAEHKPGAPRGLSPEKRAELEGRRQQRLNQQADQLQERARQLRESGDEAEANKIEQRAQGLRERMQRVAEGKDRLGARRADTRERRKLARVKRLRSKYGTALSQEPVREELQRHGRTSARLMRIKQLAQESKNTELSERVATLITRENERHTGQMTKLTEKAEQPTAPNPDEQPNTATGEENKK